MLKMMKSIKKALPKGIAVLLLFFICFTIWYYKPIQSDSTLTIYNQYGNSTDIDLHFQLYRSYFSPTEIRGQIRLNDVTYVSFGKDNSKRSIWEKLNNKFHGIYSYPFFGNQENFGPGGENGKILEDNIYIYSISFDNRFMVDQIFFFQTAGDGTSWNSDQNIEQNVSN